MCSLGKGYLVERLKKKVVIIDGINIVFIFFGDVYLGIIFSSRGWVLGVVEEVLLSGRWRVYEVCVV